MMTDNGQLLTVLAEYGRSMLQNNLSTEQPARQRSPVLRPLRVR